MDVRPLSHTSHRLVCPRHTDTRTRGHTHDTRTCGHADTRTHGHVDTRTRGNADTRTRGHTPHHRQLAQPRCDHHCNRGVLAQALQTIMACEESVSRPKDVAIVEQNFAACLLLSAEKVRLVGREGRTGGLSGVRVCAALFMNSADRPPCTERKCAKP